MLEIVLIIVIVAFVIFIIADRSYEKKANDWRNERSTPNNQVARTPTYNYPAQRMASYDEETLIWCANFLGINKNTLLSILENIPANYKIFRLPKRSGGFRSISAPDKNLLSIQRTIYLRVLVQADIHAAATGFRHGVSVADNAKVHLGKQNVLKVDIRDFFGAIKTNSVTKAFQKIGYPPNVSKVFAQLCCLRGRLPQGAPTSPALSNIVSFDMDKEMQILSRKHKLGYSRYADDLTFSGDNIDKEAVLLEITQITEKYKLVLNKKKTRFMTENKRKIITGVSISSGEKLTIPKAKKREMRKNIHFILTKGLAAHQRRIGSKDPAYLKRILGYLSFWQSVEPNNEFVINSIQALRKFKRV